MTSFIWPLSNFLLNILITDAKISCVQYIAEAETGTKWIFSWFLGLKNVTFVLKFSKEMCLVEESVLILSASMTVWHRQPVTQSCSFLQLKWTESDLQLVSKKVLGSDTDSGNKLSLWHLGSWTIFGCTAQNKFISFFTVCFPEYRISLFVDLMYTS